MSYFNNSARALVVAAHPDDEVLGCGGTVARLLSSGREVHLLILGGVTTSRYRNKSREESWKKEAFEGEAEKCAKLLRVTSLSRFEFKDNRFDCVPLINIIKSIEKVKAKVRPDLVLTHDFSDLNIDHRLTHQAVLTAFRPEEKYKLNAIAAFEIPSSTECQDQEMLSFRPNCYVDITSYIDKKMMAMKCYRSELKKHPHPRSLKGIEFLASKRGAEICRDYAEAFRIIREVF